jgi:N-acyl-D-amino-acid deacylase
MSRITSAAARAVNRRSFIKTGTLALAVATAPRMRAADEPKRLSISAAFDREMETFMSARKVPGGALAVVKEGRLVYARGYGWADRDARIPAKADSLFRIASVSKPITSVAVMKLIEEGKLSLDTKAFPFLNLQPIVASFRDPEPRLREITIQHLLQHTGGWDRDKSFDPMFRPVQIATATNSAPPATPTNIIRYMLSRELDFDPGTRYAYSNFGYCVLGRVIEKVTGQSYEKFVREKILAPIGISRMRIGATLDGKQAPGEVRYYTPDAGMAKNVFPDGAEKVPWPYGGFHLEAMDAHGGWIASAIDLARFATALDGTSSGPLLKAATCAQMYAPPPPPVSRTKEGTLEKSYYGCGWSVRPIGEDGKANYWHNGSLPGTATLLVRRWDGLSWAALFNQRSDDKKLPDGDIDAGLHRAAAVVEEWPKENLFPQWKNI